MACDDCIFAREIHDQLMISEQYRDHREGLTRLITSIKQIHVCISLAPLKVGRPPHPRSFADTYGPSKVQLGRQKKVTAMFTMVYHVFKEQVT